MTSIASSWAVAGKEIDIDRGLLVGVVNVTPDSFSDGGRYLHPDAALAHGLKLVADGAGSIDVGGESTRPGAEPVSAAEESDRVLSVVAGLAEEGVLVSIDTQKAEVAKAALDAGASVVNDVTGFSDTRMVDVVSASDCGVVVMHGREASLNSLPAGRDVVGLVETQLMERVAELADAGVDRRRVVIDPGIGFDKRPEQSLALLAGVGRLAASGIPVMVGVSRKGFLTGVVGSTDWDRRDDATAATTALAYARGARVFRVHDVAKSRDALRVAAAIVANQRWDEWLQG